MAVGHERRTSQGSWTGAIAGGFVLTVFLLLSAGLLVPLEALSYSGTGQLGGYSPADLQSAYAIAPLASANQTVAIVIPKDAPNAESDLAAYRSFYGLSPCTTANGCFRKVDQNGGTSYPVSNLDAAKEASTDLDMVSAVCPTCHMLLVEGGSYAGGSGNR